MESAETILLLGSATDPECDLYNGPISPVTWIKPAKKGPSQRAAAPSVISPLFTTNCDHYSTEIASDSIITVAPVETSPFQWLLPESPMAVRAVQSP